MTNPRIEDPDQEPEDSEIEEPEWDESVTLVDEDEGEDETDGTPTGN